MARVIKLSCVVMSSLAVLLSSSAAFAATLQSIQGKVLINHGAGYQLVTGPTAVGVGDSVMVSADGSAQVVYTDQCSVPVKLGNVVTVAAEPPCKKTAGVDFDTTRMNAGFACGDKSFCAPPEERPWAGFVPVAAIGVAVGLCVGDVICDHGASGQ